MAYQTSELMSLIQGKNQQLASCVKLLLLWVATSDGKLDETELEYLNSLFPDGSQTVSTKLLIQIVRNFDLDSKELAIRAIAAENNEMRVAFLDMAISLAVSDSRLAISENYILQFYADALKLGLQVLQNRYQAITGYKTPEPGDPSCKSWWEEIARKQQKRKQRQQDEANNNTYESSGSKRSTSSNMSKDEARAVLGVGVNCSEAEVKQAYQRLVSVFHPDRVHAMGEAAVALATERFKKIQQAYELIIG